MHPIHAEGYVPLAPIQTETTTFVGQTVDTNNLNGYLNNMFKLGIAVAGALAVVMIILGGVQYMSSDAIGKKEDGKKKIGAAMTGLIVALGSFMLLNTLSPDFLSTKLTLNDNLGIEDLASGPGDGNPNHTKDKIVKVYRDSENTEYVEYQNGDVKTRSVDGIEKTRDREGKIVNPPSIPPPPPGTNPPTPPTPGKNLDPCTNMNASGPTKGKGTLYYAAKQSDYAPGSDGTFLDENGNVLARSSASYRKAAAIEGTAILDDGRVLNYKSGTTWANTRWKISNTQYGEGPAGPLVPYRTVAADPAYYSMGQKLFVKELEGRTLPDGTTHNGYVTVGDTGAYIKGPGRLDIFTGAGKASQGDLRNIDGITVTPCK